MACCFEDTITLAGPNGSYQVFYFTCKALVASDGALIGTPAVVSSDTSKVTISGISVGSAPRSFDDVSHAAGEWFEFRATAVGAYVGDVTVTATYTTPKRQESKCVTIRRTSC